ncbi:adenylate/guanylate cyclase domain-containing protein [Rossellomorea marisflavi]|uniref:adenylate/guanylate cyclase domain-containing protein n=1 Tax=Rossellomorea marisflavi TaxID=189381 RepID=UPI003FA0950A
MRSNYKKFDFDKSLKRIDDILYSTANYDDADDIPDIEKLSFNNGKYVKCASIFIDLRGSTDLIETAGKKSKSLARLYRAYISEIVAIVNSFETCKEINIVGDCVSAMFSGKTETSNKPVIEALESASMCNAMMKVLNVKFKKKWDDFSDLKAGIGVALGRALVIKAGFNGSGIKDLVYMGDVVNRASKMCGLAYKEYESPICVTEAVYDNAGGYICNKDEDKTFQNFLFKEFHDRHGTVYTGNFYRVNIREWADNNK